MQYISSETISNLHLGADNNIELLPTFKKSELGQFMTPSKVANFMSNLFDTPNKPAKILDCGAGLGSLSISAVKKLAFVHSLETWEIDNTLKPHLKRNLDSLSIPYSINCSDFIQDAVSNILNNKSHCFSHAILNPPYKKIKSDCIHRKLLRKVGIETVNLYTAFLALTILLMENLGQIVAIIPRSFCNGPYYKPFRMLMLNTCSIEHIHIFESRSRVFKKDDVLQENIIMKLIKGKKQNKVRISVSHDQNLEDYSLKIYPYSQIVHTNDEEKFIHIPTERIPKLQSGLFVNKLTDIRLEVSTGPVVDFRLREFWLQKPKKASIPLIYPHHFSNGVLHYPKNHKKPNALQRNNTLYKWLMPNGYYVLVKRFSSKEERKRIVAYVFNKNQLDSDLIGFENHWNIYHFKKNGISKDIANGLTCFLNSTLLDKHFRVFSGHTQVNATDLKNLLYPDLEYLKKIGKLYKPVMTQEQIDSLVCEGMK